MKLVTYSEPRKQSKTRPGLLWGNWILDLHDFPAFYYSNPGKVYGPEDEVPRPSYSKALDYELEVACVLGKTGIDVSEDEAESFIAGYSIMNDWSARDVQEKEMKIG